MAELQRLLQTINGNNKQSGFVQSNFMQDKIEAAIQMKKETVGGDSDSGYSSYSCDTPTSGKGHSPMGYHQHSSAAMSMSNMKSPVIVKCESNGLVPCGGTVNSTPIGGVTVNGHRSEQVNGHIHEGAMAYPPPPHSDQQVFQQPQAPVKIENMQPPPQCAMVKTKMSPPKLEHPIQMDCMNRSDGMGGMAAMMNQMSQMPGGMAQFMGDPNVEAVVPSPECIEMMIRDGRQVYLLNSTFISIKRGP